MVVNYKGELEVLQCVSYMRHYLVAPDVFVELMKVMNYTRL